MAKKLTDISNNLFDDASSKIKAANDKWLQIIDQGNLANWSKYLDSVVDNQLTFMDKTWGNVQRALDPVFLKMPSNFDKIVKANIAATEGKMAKGIFNSTYGDFKDKNANWNNAPKATIDGIMEMIPIVGDIWNAGDHIGTLMHNRGQIADDVYREEINKLLTAQYQLEGTVLNGKGSYNEKLLETLKMRSNFWEQSLSAFKWDKGNKYYEADVREYNKVLFDIAQVKAKIADPSLNGFSNFDNKPENQLKQKLQYFRDIYLMSARTDEDFKEYAEAVHNISDPILNSKSTSDEQNKLYHEAVDSMKLIDYDAKEILKDQNQLYKDFQEKGRFYKDLVISVDTYKKYLKENVAKGTNTSNSDIKAIADQSQVILNNLNQKEIDNSQSLQDELDRNWQAYQRYEFHVKQMQFSIYKNGISLDDESLQKHLKMNDMEYEAQKELVRFQIQDETRKNEMLYQLEEQRLEAALLLEYQYKAKHDPLYAGMQSGFSTMWNEFIVGSRKAKNSWDAVWLSMRNSTLSKIGSEISNRAMDYVFKGNSGSGSKPNESTWLDTALNYASYLIPFLGEGGIVTRPTLAMIGEAGPEKVIPLDKVNDQKVIYVQPVIQGNFDVSLHKLQMKLDQNKQMMEALY